jgi:hypothetical protein
MKLCLRFFLIFLPFTIYSQSLISIDDAVRNGSIYLQGRFSKGTQAAIISVQCENTQIGEIIHQKLSFYMVNAKWFTVIGRNAQVLDLLQTNRLDISDETSISIGKQLDAQLVISGKFTRIGQNWRLELKAVNVESAQVSAQWSSGTIRPELAWSFLNSPRIASLAFAGDIPGARDKQTIKDGLIAAMQNFNTILVLDETVQGGFSYIVIIFKEAGGNNQIKADVSVSLTHNGRSICNNDPYFITETTDALIAQRIVERLKDDKVFFDKINEVVQ